MNAEAVIPVMPEWERNAFINRERYLAMYHESIHAPELFWEKFASNFVWYKRWDKVKDTSFFASATHDTRSADRTVLNPAPSESQQARKGGVRIRWFEGGKLNITENCLDRHLAEHGNKIAYFWEGDAEDNRKQLTYRELYEAVCRLANALKGLGVGKGDRVTIYLPMILEGVIAMLACARIGAVHSVVFGGFSAEALRGRIDDCGSKLVITADAGLRGGKLVPLKQNVDEAIQGLENVKHVIVVKHTGHPVSWQAERDVWYHEAVSQAPAECKAESMDAEDPLFILYTSGSTGKPKGVVHTIAGYMIWAAITHKYSFDIRPEDIFWCTADIGWITGHTYTTYAPLLNATTSVIFEGIPQYPDWGRWWRIVDYYRITIFHSAPTAIRALMREGDSWVRHSSRKTLRLLGTVGEPINPEAWNWYFNVIGGKRCPVIDAWWQTETGGHMIAPFPGATALKPGSATLPFFGVQPMIVDEKGEILEGECSGMLCIATSWPGQARTVYGDHARFEQTYFSTVPGMYFTGDGARRDHDGYYWITGRIDDVLNVSGHRLGTAEIESALVSHPHVAEAAVVGIPHEIKGQGIYAYVTLNAGLDAYPELHKELIQWVRSVISPIATPDHIHFTAALPKTRSGKIMRRILRKIAEGEYANLGDTSTLTNPEIIELLIKGRRI